MRLGARIEHLIEDWYFCYQSSKTCYLIGVAPQCAETEIFDYLMKIPSSNEWVSPLLNIIPLQLLSYHIAAHRGLDVDQPRNLAKSVTVE